jgi:PDZ domain-containing protein
MTRRTNKRRSKRWIGLAAFLILLGAMTLIPLPYYLYQPGTVENLSNYVKVENGKSSGEGSFNLTTVYSIKVNNALTLVYGLFSKDTEIRKADQVRGTLTDNEYGALLEHMMKSSQNNAIVASLQEAGLPVHIDYSGVFIRSVYPDSKAAGVLAPGDLIIEADGMPVSRLDELGTIVHNGRKAGDLLELVVMRGSARLSLEVELTAAPAVDGSGAAAPRIGIATDDQYTVEPPVKIEYAVSDIGGPSAGLMFSLELLDQVTDGELTHGRFIAGTGTIDAEGNVGQIGGIRDKMIAAEHAGVDIFFSPADVNDSDRNEKDARDEALKRGYDMTIVPVRTLAEAVGYLNNLAA